MSLFSIFKTTEYSFDGKEPYENTIALLYGHWFVIFSRLVVFVILAILPIAAYLYIKPYVIELGLADLFIVVLLVYLIIWWNNLFHAITMYLLDTWVVTDHRILNNEQHGFFNRILSEMNLSKIQDVSVQITGLIPTFLNYGNVEIQTAGTEPKFVFKEVPNPVGLKSLIMKAHDTYIAEHKDNTEPHKTNGIGSN